MITYNRDSRLFDDIDSASITSVNCSSNIPPFTDIELDKGQIDFVVSYLKNFDVSKAEQVESPKGHSFLMTIHSKEKQATVTIINDILCYEGISYQVKENEELFEYIEDIFQDDNE